MIQQRIDQDKVHVFSDSTLCVGISNPNLSNNWATILEDVLNEHGFDDQFNLAVREVQVAWHVDAGAHTIDIKKHIQTYLGERNPESSEDRIMIMSMVDDIELTKKGNTETCLHTAEELAAFAPKFKPRHWCFRWPPSEKTWCNGNHNERRGQWDSAASQMGDSAIIALD